MRTLNRPMFNMGGPIKEGVMNGIREPYKGGQLVRPGPGRPGYQGLDPRKNILKRAAGWGAGKLGLQRGWLKNIYNQARQKIGQTTQQGPWTTGPFASRATPGISGSGAAQTFMQNLRSFPGASKIGGWATKARDLAVKYPKTTALTALYGGVPLAANLPYKKIASTIADVAIPDQIYNWETGRWFNSDDTDLKPSDKKILEEKKAEVKETWTPSGTASTTPILTESMREKVASAAKDRRLNNLLDIMGYDKSKKTAVYDALIDASQIVTQAPGGEQLDITKDIISPIIAATGKRLEKPADIREAAGLLMAKGEIEKDIFQSKGGPLDQQVETLMENLNMDKATATRVAKGMPKDLREQITVDAAALKTATTHKSFVNSAKKWYPNAVVWFNEKEAKDAIGSDQKADDYLETVMTDKLTKDPTAKVAGTYIINKELIQIDGAGKAKTLFP
jgi:hypothetical protein